MLEIGFNGYPQCYVYLKNSVRDETKRSMNQIYNPTKKTLTYNCDSLSK